MLKYLNTSFTSAKIASNIIASKEICWCGRNFFLTVRSFSRFLLRKEKKFYVTGVRIKPAPDNSSTWWSENV